jgi:SAM-dependent methyltransferase
VTRDFLNRQLRRLRRVVFPRLRRPDVLSGSQRDAALDVLYRLLLARAIDEHGRRHYLDLIHRDGLTLRDVAVELAASDEFHDRLRQRTTRRFYDPPADAPEGFVDVRELIKAHTLEGLLGAAEEYYRRTRDQADRYHAKPLADIHDAPELLGSFAHLLGGLRLAPEMRVLDFGAGAGWTTRFLTQLGCAVTSMDVSPTALALGEELFTRAPLVGRWSAPRFLLFDGRRIDLPSESFDRIVCFDALHHVSNGAEVLRELGRVLRPGGIAGFSEPGPNQSKAAHAQFEMKNYTVVENDLVLTEVWDWAKAAGFTGLDVAVFSTMPYLLSLQQFDDLIAGGAELDAYGDQLRGYLTGHQTFFLSKQAVSTADSRDRLQLKANIAVRLQQQEVLANERLHGHATMTNIGPARWLPGATRVGGVNLGVHLRTRDDRPLNVDFARILLSDETAPGATRRIDFTLSPLPPGEYTLEFDLVSEGVGWFEANGSATVSIPVRCRAV